MSASGSTIMWFFAPPRAWTRLPVRGSPSRRCSGRSGSTRRTRRPGSSGCSRIAVDGDLVAVDDVEDAVGQRRPRLSSSAISIDAPGSFSDGLSTNVLPQAIALREHPHRDHRREVERGDPGDDAERLADREDVDAGRDLLAEAALEEVRARHTRTRCSRGRGRPRRARPRDLAVLRGQQGGQVAPVLVDELADPEQDLGRGEPATSPARPGTRPRPRRPPGRPRRRWRSRPRGQRTPVAGL